MKAHWSTLQKSFQAIFPPWFRVSFDKKLCKKIIRKIGNEYNIHDRFVEAQPNSLQLEGGKNDILAKSCEAARMKNVIP